MIENFRYTSSWEKFEEAVKILKDLLKQGDAYWLIGFMGDFDLYIDDEVAEEMDEEILDILSDEVMYLLYWALDEEDIDEEAMRNTITNAENEVTESEMAEIVVSVRNKFELVKDAFDIEVLVRRYNLKKDSVSLKLSDLKYNVYANKMPNGKEVNCAFINIACKKDLGGMKPQGIGTLLAEKAPEQEVTFICDEDDIDVLIHHLEGIKRNLKG